MRIRRVPAGDALDRCFEVIEAVFLHQRDEFGAEAAGARGLMHHDAAAGLLHRRDDGIEVEWPEAAQVDDFGVDAAFLRGRVGDMHHRAVGDDRERVARPIDGCRIERHRVVPVRDLAERMLRPRCHRPVVVAVKWAVVEPLGLKEDHRVVAFDGRDQQALGVIGIRRHHRAQAADVGEEGFRTLAVRLPAIDAAAARHADRQRGDELAGRAVAQARHLGDDLVGGRVKVVGELDLDNRA